jgi:hypothetical protein
MENSFDAAASFYGTAEAVTFSKADCSFLGDRLLVR